MAEGDHQMRKMLLVSAALGLAAGAPVLAHAATTGEVIVAPLPVPPVGPNATPQQYLQAAQSALQARRDREAEEALERAETRLLDRSTTPSSADQPDQSATVRQIGQARDALRRGDRAAATQIVASLNSSGAGTMGSSGAMPPAGGMAPAAGSTSSGSVKIPPTSGSGNSMPQ
jgi:hypothetical protein